MPAVKPAALLSRLGAVVMGAEQPEPTGRPNQPEAPRGPGHHIARLHRDQHLSVAPTVGQMRWWRRITAIGALGSCLLLIGGIGAGAPPAVNPWQSVPVLGILTRLPYPALVLALTGVILIILAWLALIPLIRGAEHGGVVSRLTRSELDATLLAWVFPLIIAVPMFSRDVYSYIALGMVTAYGDDPYAGGPADSLGLSHPLVQGAVPIEWLHTPAQYGPLFLGLSRVIAFLAGENILLSVILHRALAIAGIMACLWALPRLARRCGVAEVTALWLGVLNPIVLFHLIAGVHNETLMLGFMLVGVELAMRGLDRHPVVKDGAAPLFWGRPRRWWGLWVAAIVVITLAGLVKAPGFLALAFVGMAYARDRGRRWTDVAGAACVTLAVAAATSVIVSFGTGAGLGWLSTLGAASSITSWTSPATLLGMISASVGVLLGLGNHQPAFVDLTRLCAQLLAALFCVRMLFAVFRGRIPAIGGLGVALGVTVLFFPVIHPWYLAWAIMPLAAWVTARSIHIPAVALCCLFGILTFPSAGGPLGTGAALGIETSIVGMVWVGVAGLGLVIVGGSLAVWRLQDRTLVVPRRAGKA